MSPKPEDHVLLLTGNYHFGNNLGIFQHASFVGRSLALPVHLSWLGDDDTVFLFFETHDIETWETTKGHVIAINGTEIGRLKDPKDTKQGVETHEIPVKKSDFLAASGGEKNFTLEIAADMSQASPGLADDFVLTRVETANAVLRVGWR